MLAAAVCVPFHASYAKDRTSTIYDTYGEIGMLDMPSAHMAPDGELAFTMGDVGLTQRYALSFQALPWLSASFRYSHVVGLHAGFNDKHYYDRSFGFKIRLVREGTITPDISIGLRDLLGTGVYSGEYLVASKHLGRFDLTAGMGWGRFGESNALSNPLGLIFKSFKKRPPYSGSGTFNFGQFFHGADVGLYGGIVWQTPLDGLNLIAEYSSDRYQGYIYPGGLKVRTPVNVGLSYRPYDALALSAGWFYGSTYGFTVNIRGDAKSEPSTAQRLGPAIPAPVIRSHAEQQAALEQLIAKSPWNTASQTTSMQPYTLSPAARDKQTVIAALLTEGQGVRDVDVQGNTLIIDARARGNAPTQCARYAQIASASGSQYTSVAMSDLQSSNGLVTFCPVAIRAKFIKDDVPSHKMAAENTPDILEEKLRTDLEKQAIILQAVSVKNGELWLYYQNGRYRTETEAVGRIARVLMADAPSSVEVFHIVAMTVGMPAQDITVVRSALERTIAAQDEAGGFDKAISINSVSLDNPTLEQSDLITYPTFSWSADPKLTEHIFDPNAPLQFDLYARLEGDMRVTRKLTLGAVLTGNIWNNLTYSRAPDSALPHVRTDILQYLKKGEYGISFLGATYRTRLAPNVFAEMKAGYLEDMYMGVGGDVLWRPEGSRFAFGFDVYQVWKRNFNRLFGIQNYNILTGHASIYYQSPWYGLNFDLHVGRYLAGDYGATMEVSRRFSTGVEVGFFATFTNVPFKKFGEGSFDKGIFLRIPFEWALPIFSQSSYDLYLSSLTRDGGQRLANDDSLYDETQRTSYGEIKQHSDQILAP